MKLVHKLLVLMVLLGSFSSLQVSAMHTMDNGSGMQTEAQMLADNDHDCCDDEIAVSTSCCESGDCQMADCYTAFHLTALLHLTPEFEHITPEYSVKNSVSLYPSGLPEGLYRPPRA